MAERNVLLKNVKHPFLVGLHYSFQTTEKLYFVLDFVNGGEVSFITSFLMYVWKKWNKVKNFLFLISFWKDCPALEAICGVATVYKVLANKYNARCG